MFQQSEQATARALRVHAEAEARRRQPAGLPARIHVADGDLAALVRSMVRRFKRDGYKGTADQWTRLSRFVGVERK